MPKLDEQISTLEEKLKQLKLRHQRIEARKKAIETKRERKADTRRKILVGAVVMAKVEQKVMDDKCFVAGSMRHSPDPMIGRFLS